MILEKCVKFVEDISVIRHVLLMMEIVRSSGNDFFGVLRATVLFTRRMTTR